MTGLIEAIEKDAIEARKIPDLFCERLAQFCFAAEVVESADEVCEDLAGHLGADKALRELKFKNSFPVDAMRYDTEEPSTYRKRSQIRNWTLVIGGVAEGSQRPENLALKDGFYRRPEDQSQWNFEELFCVLTGGDNMLIAIVQQEKKAMTLNASRDADRLVFATLAWSPDVLGRNARVV